MFKFKFDKTPEELTREVEEAIAEATSEFTRQIKAEAGHLVETNLKSDSAKQHWNNGFEINEVNPGEFLIRIDGKLALWMEDGFAEGEVSDAILNGARAKYNKENGKRYVDVPFAKDADNLVTKSGQKISAKSFNPKNAQDIIAHFSSPGMKKPEAKKVTVNRIEDILKSQNLTSGAISYLAIKRISDNSDPWSGFSGAKIFEDLEDFINENLEEVIRQRLEG